MRHPTMAIWALLAAAFPGAAWGQVLLVNVDAEIRAPLPRPMPIPRPEPPPTSYKIKELTVQGTLVDQVARVQVSQSFVNTGSRPMEVSFVFPLPYDGAIESLTLLVDGKEFPAKLLDAKQARAEYEKIVRQNLDPALLEWVGTGMFKTSVFPVPPGAERKVTLRYSQVCRQSDGLTDFLFPLSTARFTSQPVERIAFDLSLESRVPIKNVYSPSHAIDIKRPDDRRAQIHFEATSSVPTQDFRLFYDGGAGVVGASVLSFRRDSKDDGYFLLLATPEIKESDAPRLAKTVVFVVDRSGSMSGKKIEQAKEAARFVLNSLRDGDLFNIVAYDSEVQAFRPELQKFSDESRRAALAFVEGLYAGGSTNIEGALKTALPMFQDSSRPGYLLFLTDGLPTVGEQNEAKLAAMVRELNAGATRIFTFGVGYDVNSRLLDKLARFSGGLSNYTRPDENLEGPVSKLANKLSSPVMTDLQIHFELDGSVDGGTTVVNRVYPRGTSDLFRGEQLAVTGRYSRPGAVKVVITGKVGQEQRRFEFPSRFVEQSGDDAQAFVEKLWAIRRVGEILDELDLKGRNEELIQELVALSTRHGIITPYTSFLADEGTNLGDRKGNTLAAADHLKRLETSPEGRGGFNQRLGKNILLEARQLDAASNEALYRSFGGRPIPGAALPAADGRFGGVGSRGAQAAPVQQSEAEAALELVQTIGRKAFFQRGGKWIDSAVDENRLAQARQIKRFSDEYFALVSKHGAEVGKYLAIEDPLVIDLDGQIYEIVDP